MYQQKLCLGLLGGVVPGAEQIPMLRDAGFDGFFLGGMTTRISWR